MRIGQKVCTPVGQTFTRKFFRCCPIQQQGYEIHKTLFRHVAVVYQGSVCKVELIPIVGEEEVFAGFRFRQGGGNFGEGELCRCYGVLFNRGCRGLRTLPNLTSRQTEKQAPHEPIFHIYASHFCEVKYSIISISGIEISFRNITNTSDCVVSIYISFIIARAIYIFCRSCISETISYILITKLSTTRSI